MDTMIRHWTDEDEGGDGSDDEGHGEAGVDVGDDEVTGPDAGDVALGEDDGDAKPDAQPNAQPSTVDPYVLIEEDDGHDPESTSAQVLVTPEASSAQQQPEEIQDSLGDQVAQEASSAQYVESQASSQIAPEASPAQYVESPASSQIAPEASPAQYVESQSQIAPEASSAQYVESQAFFQIAPDLEASSAQDEALLAQVASSTPVAREAVSAQESSTQLCPEALVAREAVSAQLLQEPSPSQDGPEALPKQTIQAAATPAQVLVTPVQAPASGAPSSSTSPHGKGFVAAADAASRRAEVLARIEMLKHLCCM